MAAIIANKKMSKTCCLENVLLQMIMLEQIIISGTEDDQYDLSKSKELGKDQYY